MPVPVGGCARHPDEPRLRKALPSVESRTIYEMLNQLRYGEGFSLKTPLDREHRDFLAATLLQAKPLTFDKLRSTLRLPTDARFSLEENGKKDLKDFVSKSGKAMSHKGRFGSHWSSLPLEQRDAIVQRLIDEPDEARLASWLVAEHGLDDAAARAVADWIPPDGIARLGATANAAVLAELRADHLCTYSEAVRRAGERLGRHWHHSDFRDGEIQVPLPYYGRVLERHVSFGTGDPDDAAEGRFGRLPDPPGHIGLGP